MVSEAVVTEVNTVAETDPSSGALQGARLNFPGSLVGVQDWAHTVVFQGAAPPVDSQVDCDRGRGQRYLTFQSLRCPAPSQAG